MNIKQEQEYMNNLEIVLNYCEENEQDELIKGLKELPDEEREFFVKDCSEHMIEIQETFNKFLFKLQN